MSRRKTKRWISSERAITFDVVYRSNRDLHASEKDASPLVLVPKATRKKLQRRDFTESTTASSSTQIPSFIPSEVLPHELDEDPEVVGRDLNVITPLQLKELDPELLAALQNPDEFEELDDDFIALANAPEDSPVQNDKEHVEDEVVNVDDIHDESGNELGTRHHVNITLLEPFDDVDSTIKQLDSSHLVNEVDSSIERRRNTPSANVKINEENAQSLSNSTQHFTRQRNTLLEEQFYVTLSKYEQPSAEYSENNSDDERLCGVDNLDQFNDVFDEFLKSHRKHSTNDELFAKDKSLVLHPTDDNNENENETDSSDIDNVDRELEELFLAQDGDDDDVQQYDCESILSTYSNTENHPALICEEEVPTRKIQLNRYGIPKHVLNKSQHSQMTSNDSTTSTTEQEKKKVNLGQARPRHENPNERHNRKQQLKQERRTKRALKKALKMTYKNEEQQQQRQRNSGVLQSKKVMRY